MNWCTCPSVYNVNKWHVDANTYFVEMFFDNIACHHIHDFIVQRTVGLVLLAECADRDKDLEVVMLEVIEGEASEVVHELAPTPVST